MAFFRTIGVAITLLCLDGCLADNVKEDLPPGVAHLKNSKGGRGFDAFVEEALRESELFRRRLLQGADEGAIDTRLLAESINRFCDEAPAHLQGRRGIKGFRLSEAELRGALKGQQSLDAAAVYGGFTGKWYGMWDQMHVDHHWGRILQYDPSRRIEIAGQAPVFLRSQQYCWVGDGYGLNVIATEHEGSVSCDYLLGYVIHIREGDMTQTTKRRPHVGICIGPGKLIWVTAGEVFLEEIYKTQNGKRAYAITGFFYRVKDRRVETTGCFQANYTKNRVQRPDWFSFSLNLKLGPFK